MAILVHYISLRDQCPLVSDYVLVWYCLHRSRVRFRWHEGQWVDTTVERDCEYEGGSFARGAYICDSDERRLIINSNEQLDESYRNRSSGSLRCRMALAGSGIQSQLLWTRLSNKKSLLMRPEDSGTAYRVHFPIQIRLTSCSQGWQYDGDTAWSCKSVPCFNMSGTEMDGGRYEPRCPGSCGTTPATPETSITSTKVGVRRENIIDKRTQIIQQS